MNSVSSLIGVESMSDGEPPAGTGPRMKQRIPTPPGRRRKGSCADPAHPSAGRRASQTFLQLGRFGVYLSFPLLLHTVGCGIAPRNFQSLNHPAAIVRARSVAYGEGLPEWQVIPPLIDRLSDPDPVVRLTAHEELRRRTGQDFHYVPWGQPEERAGAVARWQEWWRGRKAALARNRQIP